MRKLINLLIVLLISSVSGLYAQDKVVHGIINTLDSIPLIGAEITVKSSKQVVYTDTLGRFSVQSNAKDKLKIRADGFVNQNVNVSPNTKVVAVNLKMKPGDRNREYQIGYGVTSDAFKTGAVDNLDRTESNFMRYDNMFDLLQSSFSGIQVVGGEIIIRGNQTFQGSNAALIVVDGVVSDSGILNQLRPFDIKSVNIIKDGSSAVYGSRGANGVILIETVKGGDR